MRRELCQLISDVILGIASHFGVIQTEIGIIIFCNHPRSGFQFHLPKFLVHKDFYSFVLPEYNPVGNQVQETVSDPIWLEIGFGYTFWGGLQKLKRQWFAWIRPSQLFQPLVSFFLGSEFHPCSSFNSPVKAVLFD